MQTQEVSGVDRRSVANSALDGLAGEGGLDGAKGAEGVEGLREPAVGLGFLGQEDIGLSVEQQQHGTVFEIAHGDALFHGKACGHAAHVADLQIEQDEPGIDLANRGDHIEP